MLLVLGAMLVVLRSASVPFDATPLMVGVALLVATAVGPPPRSWAAGTVITAWGVGVLLTRSGVVPGAEAPVFLIATGVGLLVVAWVTPVNRARSGLLGAALAVVSGGVLYLAVDLVGQPWLMTAWPWAAALGAAGAVELARPEPRSSSGRRAAGSGERKATR